MRDTKIRLLQPLRSSKLVTLVGLGCLLTFLVTLDFSIITSMLHGHGTKVLRIYNRQLLPIDRELVVDEEHLNLDVISAFQGTSAQVPRGFSFLGPNQVTMFKSWDEPSIVDVHDDKEWLPAKRPYQLPRNFNWHEYFLLNPDVAAHIPNNAMGAAHHYITGGFREGRVYSRLGVKLRYSSCPPAGVITQHYAHLSAAILATLLGADLILPPAWSRDNGMKSEGRARWSLVGFRTLWDAEYIHQLWGSQRQNFTTRDVLAYTLDPARVVPAVIDGPRPLPIKRLLELIRSQAANRAGEVYQRIDAFAKAYPPMLVELPCPLLMVNLSEVPLAASVAQQFRFNPVLQGVANYVVQELREVSATGFNGLHLLGVENNKTGFLQLPGSSDPGWLSLQQACVDAQLQPDALLYVASDLLASNDPEVRRQVAELLSPVAGRIAHLGIFLSPKQLAGMGPEQHALVDFLVLTHADTFVGAGESHYSVFVREYRQLLGMKPRSTSVLTPVPAELAAAEQLASALIFA